MQSPAATCRAPPLTAPWPPLPLIQVAMRKLAGVDLPIADCEAVIRRVDQNGDMTLNFDEFCLAVQNDDHW